MNLRALKRRRVARMLACEPAYVAFMHPDMLGDLATVEDTPERRAQMAAWLDDSLARGTAHITRGPWHETWLNVEVPLEMAKLQGEIMGDIVKLAGDGYEVKTYGTTQAAPYADAELVRMNEAWRQRLVDPTT